MVDKAAIFTEVTKRNLLRKEAGLPLLDVRAEFDHQVAVAAHRKFSKAAEAYADKKAAIHQLVLEKYRSKHGQQFGHTMGGRWAVGLEVNRRFRAFLAQQDLHEPKWSDRHIIVYGELRHTEVTGE